MPEKVRITVRNVNECFHHNLIKYIKDMKILNNNTQECTVLNFPESVLGEFRSGL